jgi:hypothetical protein
VQGLQYEKERDQGDVAWYKVKAQKSVKEYITAWKL